MLTDTCWTTVALLLHLLFFSASQRWTFDWIALCTLIVARANCAWFWWASPLFTIVVESIRVEAFRFGHGWVTRIGYGRNTSRHFVDRVDRIAGIRNLDRAEFCLQQVVAASLLHDFEEIHARFEFRQVVRWNAENKSFQVIASKFLE